MPHIKITHITPLTQAVPLTAPIRVFCVCYQLASSFNGARCPHIGRVDRADIRTVCDAVRFGLDGDVFPGVVGLFEVEAADHVVELRGVRRGVHVTTRVHVVILERLVEVCSKDECATLHCVEQCLSKHFQISAKRESCRPGDGPGSVSTRSTQPSLFSQFRPALQLLAPPRVGQARV